MSVQSLDRTFNLLELLARFPEGLALSDISIKIGLNKSTVRRLLGSLKERSYIEQDESSGRYLYRCGLYCPGGPLSESVRFENCCRA